MLKTAEGQPEVNMEYMGAFMDEVLNPNIFLVPSPTCGNPRNVCFKPRLVIYGKEKRGMETIQERIVNGVAWRLKSVVPDDDTHKEWMLMTRNSFVALAFIEWIEPYLTIKKGQMQIFADFLRHKLADPNYPNADGRIEAESSFRQRLLLVKSEIVPETSLPGLRSLAGIIDADMTMRPYDTRGFPANGKIISARKGLLGALHKQYGGAEPTEASNMTRSRIYLPTFRWDINGSDLGRLLIDVAPYLLLKKGKAEAILEFLEKRKTNRRLLPELLEKWFQKWPRRAQKAPIEAVA